MLKHIKFLLTIFIALNSFAAAEEDYFPDASEKLSPLNSSYIYQSVNVITGEYCENQIDLIAQGPCPVELRRCYASNDPYTHGWHFNHPNLPAALWQDAPLPEEHRFSYLFDDQGRLSAIRSKNGNPIMTFRYSGEPDSRLTCIGETENGSYVRYSFSKFESTRSLHPYLLEKVETSTGKEISYSYQNHPQERKKLITMREEAEGRYLLTEYYDSFANNVGGTVITLSDLNRNPTIGKVKLQKAPVGEDNTPVITSRFFYHQGHTEVRDALNHKTLYHYNGRHKLTAIESYLDDDALYRVERYYWDDKEQLISKTIEDSHGIIAWCQTFEYDSSGNRVKQTLYGNLSGTSQHQILIDDRGIPQHNGVERYSTTYKYTDGESPLVALVEEDNGQSTRFIYNKETGQLTRKLVYASGHLYARYFYEYDREGLLTSEVVDDGATEDPNDLGHVTERKITRLFASPTAHSSSLPNVIENLYYDPSTQSEKLIKRTVLTYSDKGECLAQDIYAGDGTYRYTQSNAYDDCGRLVQTTDEQGRLTQMSYDRNGNLIEKRDTNSTTLNTYDFSNRLIRTECVSEGKPHTITSQRYDYCGNLTATIDIFGNETSFEYDALGRLIKTLYPLVSTPKTGPIRPIVTNQYDILDRVTSTTDANGYTKKTQYNTRGKPLSILYPDGTSESFEYYLDGSLKKQKQRNGCYTLFTRDCLSRIINESRYDSDGKLIQSLSRVYTTFHLVSETNLTGAATFYEYDAAGRQSGIHKYFDDITHHTQFIYDNLGRLSSQKEWFGDNSQDSSLTQIERDPTDQIAAVTLYNHAGEVIKRNELKQDNTNNKTYQFDHFNDLGQNVLQIIETDSFGARTITTCDAIGRPCAIEKRNLLNEILLSKEIAYDPAGNKVEERHVGQHGSSYICQWEYGPENRVEAAIEGCGTPSPRKTYYAYDHFGNLQCVTKPDGVSLYYTYTAAGKLREVISSDYTINYLFHYDALNRPIRCFDKVNNLETVREYNQRDQATYERLGNGLEFSHEYDPSGKRVGLTLPDNSKIEYTHDTGCLKSVKRLDPLGNTLYCHQYIRYSPIGKVLEEALIGNAGPVSRSYNESGHLQSICSPYWKQDLDRDSTCQIASIRTEDPSGHYTTTYNYDPLQRLTQESGPSSHTYTYDFLGNRSSIDQDSTRIDSLGQLISQGTFSFRYDPNGNMIEKQSEKGTLTLKYDALNRLIHASIASRFVITYTYDPFHRLIARSNSAWDSATSSWLPTITEHYLYDGFQEIGCSDEAGHLKELRVPGADAAISIELGNAILAPVYDSRGSICCLVDSQTGQPIEWNRYSALGSQETTSLSGRGTGNPWTYCGKRIDHDTGLLFFGKRFYDPEVGRWITKDPLGTPDSINRYTFCMNNPNQYIDIQGLFSFSELWDTIWGGIKSAYTTAMHYLDTIKDYFSITRSILPAIDQFGRMILGRTFLLLSGFYKDASETGIHGKGELNDKVRITLINGVLNARCDFKDTIQAFSDAHGGTNIHYIFDSTDGWCWDLIKCAMVKLGYDSPQSHTIADTWRALIDEMGGIDGGGLIIHYAHSIGSTHTKAALRLLTPEEKKMIKIYTFGSPSIIDDKGLQGVYNYVSVRDGVCLLDPIGYFSGILGMNEAVISVGNWLGIPFIDHLLENESYMDIVKTLGQQFLEQFL